jgi:hypothetical protein
VHPAHARCPVDPARLDGYAPREPERTALHRVVSAHWPDFLARAEAHEPGLPRFVTREVEDYLRCGLLRHGFAELACTRCGNRMLVAFSCKHRGFCPSCTGRRMADVAAHLVDHVLPAVPVRQWVITLPWRLRVAVAYDRRLCADVLGAFLESLEASLRRRAKATLGFRRLADAEVGAVTFIQRSDGALRANPHFHSLVLDGVYVRDRGGTLVFEALPPPMPEDVADVARRTHARLVRVLARHGRALDGPDDHPDAFASGEPVLASLYAASAADVQLLGEAPGQRSTKRVRHVRLVDERARGGERVAEHEGLNVHAETWVDGRDRLRLERLCRYVARPPLASERLSLLPDGRVRYAFKAPWRDGTDAVILSPMDLLARLCALVPPPRFHLVRYFGVLAARAACRPEVVPGRPAPLPPAQPALFSEADLPALSPPSKPPSRHAWAWLLRRVFRVEVEPCGIDRATRRRRNGGAEGEGVEKPPGLVDGDVRGGGGGLSPDERRRRRGGATVALERPAVDATGGV